MDKIDIDKLPDDKFVNMKNRSQCDLMMIWLVPLLRYHVSCKDFCWRVQKKLFQTTMAKMHPIDNKAAKMHPIDNNAAKAVCLKYFYQFS